MTNPVPDDTWGYLEPFVDDHTHGATLYALIKALLSVCSGLYCPFFFLEVKPDNGSFEQLRNQARKAGAISVHVMRQLLNSTGRIDTLGPDFSFYVYRVTMNEECMECWVDWAEVRKDNMVHYHINRLKKEDFESNNSLLNLQRFTYNILEWEMTTRLPTIRDLIASLYRRETFLRAENNKKEIPAPARELSTATKRKKAKSTSGSL